MQIDDHKRRINLIVNELIEKTFGKGFKGNYLYIDEFPGPVIKTVNHPNQIIKRHWLPIPFLYEIMNYVGDFTNEDGSELSVLAKYSNNAKEYAELYEEIFSKEVRITIK